MSRSSDMLPRDVVLLLRDAETFLSDCLEYEDVSNKGREIGKEILRGFWAVRNRYFLDFQQAGVDTFGADASPDNYDNHSLSYGTSQASDEVSSTSDYVDDDTEEPEKPLKQGYLEKHNKVRGFFGSEWQKRWCVLTNMSFWYFSSEKGKVPKGGFFIKNCSANLAPHIGKDSRRGSCFELVSPNGHSYQFAASSPAEARKWVDQIQFLVKDIQSASIPCDDDEDSYDEVDSLNSSSIGQAHHWDRASIPIEEDEDIYEVVPDDGELEFHSPDPRVDGSIINYADYYQGLWDCTGNKSDELSFQRGNIIRILSKEYNAYGWWVGELDGMVGLVPKDYLQVAYELEGF